MGRNLSLQEVKTNKEWVRCSKSRVGSGRISFVSEPILMFKLFLTVTAHIGTHWLFRTSQLVYINHLIFY